MSEKVCPTCSRSTRVLPGRESTKPYVVFTEVIHATKEWVEAAEVLRATSTETARLHRLKMNDVNKLAYVRAMEREDAAQAELRAVERRTMTRLTALVRGQTFTGLPK